MADQEWKEAKAIVAPGKVFDFQRGYRVNQAGRHEDAVQYRAFQIYVNMGSQRSIEGCAKLSQHAFPTIRTWHDKWNWSARAAAWDKIELKKTFQEANKLERRRHKKEIEAFRAANEEQARMMMDVSNNMMEIIQQRLDTAKESGEEIPMGLVSGLMRAAANISEQGRQAWATSLGVNELMHMIDEDIEEVEVEVEGEDPYEIPIED